MCAVPLSLPDPRPVLGAPEEWFGPGTLFADGVATVSRPLLVACWMARASALESANVDCHSGRREVRHRTRMHTRHCTYAAKLVTSHHVPTALLYISGCIYLRLYLYILRLYLYISGCIYMLYLYISGCIGLYLYISGCTYTSPTVHISDCTYISPLYLYISGCIYISPAVLMSPAVLIYLRLYLYISGCTYIYPAVPTYLRLYVYISGCSYISPTVKTLW